MLSIVVYTLMCKGGVKIVGHGMVEYEVMLV